MGTLPATIALLFSSREEWRRFLEANHARVPAAWLAIRRKHASAAGLAYEEAVEEALCFGWIDGQMRPLDEQRYLLRFSPRRPGSLWSLANRKRAEALIAAGKMAPPGMARVHEAMENGRWAAAYTSKCRPAIPADLQEALDQDPGAAARFARWSASMQIQYVVWIEEAKRPETRKKRIRAVVERCKSVIAP